MALSRATRWSWGQLGLMVAAYAVSGIVILDEALRTAGHVGGLGWFQRPTSNWRQFHYAVDAKTLFLAMLLGVALLFGGWFARWLRCSAWIGLLAAATLALAGVMPFHAELLRLPWNALVFQPIVLMWIVASVAVGAVAAALGTGSLARCWCGVACAGFAFATSETLGVPLRAEPLLYHDEYSYLFAADCYLGGRFAFPTPPVEECFRQLHVLTSPCYASRYFPGTGLWLAPFVAIDQPFLAGWMAHAIVSGTMAAMAFRKSPLAGWLTGVLIALAPGMVSFANLLLSPMPTMLGMALFLFAYQQMTQTRSWFWPAAAGLAMGFAFLCRPMTAAALGFPFAAHAVYRLFDHKVVGSRRQFVVVAFSFTAVAVILPVANRAVTGDMLVTPYGEYTARVTPSHVYGFYNRTRGLAARAAEVDAPYDDWAIEHTPVAGLAIVWERWYAMTATGALGFLVSSCALFLWLAYPAGRDDSEVLAALGIVGLNFAYAPYWFDGLLGYSYVAEGMPWLLWLCVLGATRAALPWRAEGLGVAASVWPLALLLRGSTSLLLVLPNLFDPGSDLMFPRLRDRPIRDRVEQLAKRQPMLLLVDADPKNAVHTTLVFNRPDLSGPVVRAWYRPEKVDALIAMFPGRVVYLLTYRGMDKPFDLRPYSPHQASESTNAM